MTNGHKQKEQITIKVILTSSSVVFASTLNYVCLASFIAVDWLILKLSFGLYNLKYNLKYNYIT